MKLTELSKPYMNWKMEFEQKFKNLFYELQEIIPNIETPVYKSTLDEEIVTTQDLDGNIENTKYILKSSQNGKKFSYEHCLKENDNIAEIRQRAWEQKEAWEYKITENLKSQTNGKITQS